VEVQGAKLEHGLLTIDLARELPEALKPRAIPIGKAEPLALPN
jgi:molecular chaperone IbpA